MIDSDNFIFISSKVENFLDFGYQVNSVLNIYIVNQQTQICSHPTFPIFVTLWDRKTALIFITHSATTNLKGQRAEEEGYFKDIYGDERSRRA